MKLVKVLAVALCLFCCSVDVAEARLRGGGGGLLSRRGGNAQEDCPDGNCGLLGRLRGRNDPAPTPTPYEPEFEPSAPAELEASTLPPWAYMIFGAPAVLILAGCLGGGSYLLTRKLQEGD